MLQQQINNAQLQNLAAVQQVKVGAYTSIISNIKQNTPEALLNQKLFLQQKPTFFNFYFT